MECLGTDIVTTTPFSCPTVFVFSKNKIKISVWLPENLSLYLSIAISDHWTGPNSPPRKPPIWASMATTQSLTSISTSNLIIVNIFDKIWYVIWIFFLRGLPKVLYNVLNNDSNSYLS